MDTEIHIRNLVYKYISNQCESHEQDELLRYLQTPAGKWVFDEVMTSEAGKIFTKSEEIEPAVSKRLLGRFRQNNVAEEAANEQPLPFYRKSSFIPIVALLVLLAALALYWFMT